MAADVPAQAPVAIAQPVTFDLGNYEAERAASAKLLDPHSCGGAADEIVVCAPDQTRFRLKRDALPNEDRGFDTTMNLAPGLTVTPHVEAAQLQSGVQSNRVMMTFKLKL